MTAGLAAGLAGCGAPTARPDDTAGPSRARPADEGCQGADCRLDKLARELDAIHHESAQASPSWQVATSPSFRVIHRAAAERAQRVAARAEKIRLRQLKFWGVADAEAAWSPKCDITIYPSSRSMRLMTGATHGSAQSSAPKLRRGKLLSRKINLFLADRRLLSDTLPHEISHIVLRELVGNRRLPMWANEGMAVLWESRRKTGALYRLLAAQLRARSAFALDTLMLTHRYPDDPRQKTLFYAQSAAVVLFLSELDASPQTFLAFLNQISPPSYTRHRTVSLPEIEAALARHYDISGVPDLTRRWRRHMEDYLEAARTRPRTRRRP